MAQQYTSTQGTLFIPQATTSIQVASAPAGTAATGIIAIVGEADAGAPYSVEVAGQGLANNSFGPGQLSQFVAKYKSGPLVDAFRALVNPSKDQQIPGAPTKIIAVKTNGASTALGSTGAIKASAALLDWSGSAYGTLYDQNYGTLGNLLYTSITAASVETLPTTGPFTWIPNVASLNFNVRVNGGSSGSLDQAIALSAGTSPAALVSAITLTGVSASGGTARTTIVSSTGTLAITVVSGKNVTFTYSQAWTTQPSVGDTVVISSGSVIEGGSNQNVGGYVVTASGATTISATKLADGTSGTPGTVTSPVSVGAQAVSGSPNTDFEDFAPVTIAVAANTTTTAVQVLPTSTINVTATAGLPSAGTVFITTTAGVQTVEYTGTAGGNQLTGCTGGTGSTSNGGAVDLPVDGLGRSLAISALTTGTDIFNRYAYALSTSLVTWASTPALPTVIVPTSEYSVSQQDQRQVDGLNETITAGGVVALALGYVGTTATITVSTVNGQLQISSAATGGTGAALPTVLASAFNTISAFVAWVNTKTGWYAVAPNGRAGLQPLSSLDSGTFSCVASLAGEYTARLKTDAYSYFQALSASIAVQLGTASSSTPVQAAAGLPAPFIGNDFLSGASRGGTLQTDFTAAIDALKVCTLNFVVPLFSRDAVVAAGPLNTPTADVPNGVTESDSTYVLSGIHNYVLTHCLQMSQLQYKKNRQGFLSCRTTFLQAQAFATTQGNGRVSMCFQDAKLSNSQGQLTQYQPWMLACLAAGMQAAGGYRLIVNKYINCSGVLQAAGDFSDQSVDQMNTALQQGLLPAQLATDGSNQFWWVSDQTTYCTDSNFYANSVQAIYIGDIIALTLSQRAQKAFVGQSVADVTANQGVSFINAVMADMKRLKYIAPSSDALKGWKNLSITVNPPAMTFSLEIKLATGIYFVPISATYSQVQQTASSGVSSS